MRNVYSIAPKNVIIRNNDRSAPDIPHPHASLNPVGEVKALHSAPCGKERSFYLSQRARLGGQIRGHARPDTSVTAGPEFVPLRSVTHATDVVKIAFHSEALYGALPASRPSTWYVAAAL
jgi:hypothetical protein